MTVSAAPLLSIPPPELALDCKQILESKVSLTRNAIYHFNSLELRGATAA